MTQQKARHNNTKELPMESLELALRYAESPQGRKNMVKHEGVLPLISKEMGGRGYRLMRR